MCTLNEVQDVVVNTENLLATEFHVVGVSKEHYPDNDAGYQYDYTVKLGFNEERYDLFFQAQEPIYLSGAWVSRENGGSDTAGFFVSPATRDLDDQEALIADIKKAIGVKNDDDDLDYDIMAAVNRFVKSAVDMTPDDE